MSHVAGVGDRRGACWVSVGKHQGRRPLGKVRRRWDDNIKVDLQEMEWGSMDWIDLVQSRNRCWAVVNAEMNSRFP